MHLKKLSRSFYLQPTLRVAKGLLGTYLCRRLGGRILIGRIVEVEAYLGAKDPASHAYRGMTKRNEVMFRTGGHLYVYFTYGMHFCCNVVTEQKGKGCAVLLRAVEPVEGLDLMVRNRGASTMRRSGRRSTAGIADSVLLNLCSGPAKLCQAFGISGRRNGTDLCGNNIWIAGETNPSIKPKIRSSHRVGISYGRHHRWRFYVEDNPYVSTA